MLPVDWTGLSAKLPTQPEDATPSAALFAQCDPTGRGMADADSVEEQLVSTLDQVPPTARAPGSAAAPAALVR